MEDFTILLDLCRGKGRPIYIQTHNFPDPDAIASAYGLQKLFAHFGVETRICYGGRIDKLSASKMPQLFDIEMTPYDTLRATMVESDPIICVDSQKNAGNITDFVGDEIAAIDHHPTYVQESYQYADLRITGACATIIADYYRQLGLTPDQDTATALLYGLKMDTLQFSRGVTPLDISVFAFLHPLCNHEKLAFLERNNMEFQDLKAYGAAIENIELYGVSGFSHIPFSCSDAMIAVLADFILSLHEVDIAIVSSRREDGIKISVRSETSKVHAGELTHRALAGIGDGGGHATMAGGLVPQSHPLGPYFREELRDRFLHEIEQMEAIPK